MDKLKILLIGTGIKVKTFANMLKNNSKVDKIYIAPGIETSDKFWENIDIRENNVEELLKFVLDNDINLTVPLSENALKSDIAGFFQTNNQNIFAPTKQASKIMTDKIAGKKFLYKYHSKMAKFCVCDKINTANDFLQHCTFPIIVKSDTNSIICTSLAQAKKTLLNFFNDSDKEIIIEEYIYGSIFTIYYVTDGYSAVPITSVENLKFAKDGNLTSGVGCFAPNYKISNKVNSEINMLANTIIKVLEGKRTPYMGIFGIECFLTDVDEFLVNEIKPFFSDIEAPVILNSLNTDFLDIIYSCINGFFSDEYEDINLRDEYFISVLAKIKNQQNNIKSANNDFNIETFDKIGGNILITKHSTTLKRAKDLLREELEGDFFEACIEI